MTRTARTAFLSGLLGGAIGLVAGLIEAAWLFRFPRPPLLTSDAGAGIWFVAPVADLALGGLIGVALAPLVIVLRTRRPAPKAAALAVYAGLAALLLFEGRAGRLVLPFSWRWTAGVLLLALGSAGYWRLRLRSFLEGEGGPYHRALTAALLGGAAAALLGIAVFSLKGDFAPSRAVAASAFSRSRPSVVLITLDTVRADHFSLYGYPRATTPNLDRWAERGVVFQNAIAPSSWTLASHASMFTGLLPHQHGADWFVPLDGTPWTLAEILKAYGYQTFGFSSNSDFGEAGWGIARGFEVYDDASASLWHDLRSTWAGNRLLQPLYYAEARPDSFDRIPAGEVNRDVLRQLARRSGRPFFLFINYFDAHGPYVAPPLYRKRFGEASDALLRQAWPLLDAWDPAIRLSPGQREGLIAGYDNCLAYLDAEVGRLLEALSRQPDWTNTMVIITSDHGEAFGEHGTYSHGLNLYPEVLHVPLVVFGPGIPSGRRVTTVVSVRNLFDTVLDAGLEPLAAVQSSSLRRFWEPGFKPGPLDDLAISELASPGAASSSISLTTSGWQYIRDSAGHRELHPWGAPAGQSANLAESLPRETERLDALLRERIQSSLGPWAGRSYLSALAPAGGLEAPTAAPGAESRAGRLDGPAALSRIGASQAYFPARASQVARRLKPPDEELLRSLPYH